ncbi:MAG: hypothetical protein ACNS60_09960 [Candidatus Cyclobacteriaceae bacterium M2_1C_046]
MKKLIIYILLLTPCLLNAQKYKDVFPLITNSSDEEAKTRLINYLFTDLDHPNANLRLGMIYEKNYKSTDVLTNYKRALAFADKCKLQYIKCRTIIDEKEVSRNDEYYEPFATSFDKKGRPVVDFATVKAKIYDGYDSAVLFIEKIPPIYENFTFAVDNYGEAYKLFYEINDEYKSLDELMMLYNKDLEQKLLTIKAKMDTSLARFENYKALIADYPINSYHQQVSLKPLNYYRLDGLSSESSFLQNDIVLWDYSKWVDAIINLHNNDIRKLRQDIITLENDLNNTLEQLEKANVAEEEDFITPEKEFIHQLKKYDYQSVTLGIFEYKTFKQKLISKKKQKLFYDTVSQQNDFSRFNFYSELIKQQVLADSFLISLSDKVEENKIAKHQEFIDKYYGGSVGLKNFIKNEKETGVKDFNFYKLKLRNDILDEINSTSKSDQQWVKFDIYNLPLFKNENDSASLKNYLIVTTEIEYRADSSMYIAGYLYGKDTSRSKGYIAHLNPDKKVKWVKEFDISIDSGAVDSSTQIAEIEVSKDGCALVARSAHINMPLAVNTFIYLDDDGNEKVNLRLEQESYPRKILSDQDKNRFLLGLKGNEKDQIIEKEENFSLIAINTLGDKLWQRDFSFSGTVEDVLNVQNGYLLVGNYRMIKDHQGKIYRTGIDAGGTNGFALNFTEQGDILKVIVYEKPHPYHISKVYKVNDGNIHLFGFKEMIQGDLSYTNDNLFHLMINKQLEEIRID